MGLLVVAAVVEGGLQTLASTTNCDSRSDRLTESCRCLKRAETRAGSDVYIGDDTMGIFGYCHYANCKMFATIVSSAQ